MFISARSKSKRSLTDTAIGDCKVNQIPNICVFVVCSFLKKELAIIVKMLKPYTFDWTVSPRTIIYHPEILNPLAVYDTVYACRDFFLYF